MVLNQESKTHISAVTIAVRDTETIPIFLGDGTDNAGSGAGAFDGIPVAVYPFIGEAFHIIGGYGDVQFNCFIRSNFEHCPFQMITVFVLSVSGQVVVNPDIKGDGSLVTIAVRDLEIIVIIVGDGSDGAGSSAGTFDGIAGVVCPFIGEAFHIIGGYGDVQFNCVIRSNMERCRSQMITVFVLSVSSQVVVNPDITGDGSLVAIAVRDSEIIVIHLGDGTDGAGSGAGAFDGIAVVVCPFIGEAFHIIGGYGDIQCSCIIRSCVNSSPVRRLTVFVLSVCIQVVFYTDSKIYRSHVSVGVKDLEMIGFSFCDRPDSAGSGTGTFDRIPRAVCPFIGEAFHIIGGYKGVQFSSFIRSCVNSCPVSLIAVFIFCICSQVILYENRK